MFNQRKPRRFNYKSRLSQSEDTDPRKELKAKWSEMRENTKRRKSVFTSLPVLIIFLILLFVLIYILDGYIK